MDILCLGAVVLDVLAGAVPTEIGTIQKQHVEKIEVALGGDASNQAITAAKLGGSVGLAGCVGKDNAGLLITGRLQELSVNTKHVQMLSHFPTTVALVLLEENGERHIFVQPGAHAQITKEDVDRKVLKEIKALSVGSLFSSPVLEEDGLREILQEAQEYGVLTFADMGPGKEGTGFSGIIPFLPYLDYFLPSEYEAQALSGKETLSGMADVFLSYGVKNIVIKCGADGCYCKNAEEEFHVKTCKVKPVDTTGAGDCFVGAFITQILAGASLRNAARYACAAGTLHTQYVGASNSPLTHDKVLAFQKEKGI